MKSAYELAMERLAKSDPTSDKPLSDQQKERLAELDRVYKGKIAEREIFLKQHLEAALGEGKPEAIDAIKTQLANERIRLEEERDAEKQRVREG